jgi:hypothetical protein
VWKDNYEGATMNVKFLQRLSVGALAVGLLTGCGSSTSTSDEGSTPASVVPITEASTTSVEMPTTTVFVDTRPACEISAVDPNQVDSMGRSIEGLAVIECIGDWMITQNADCLECEGVIPLHIEDNAWKLYDPIYTYCYSVPMGYGPDPEGTPVDQSNIRATIEIAVAGYPCDETDKGYRPESMTEPLMFGDIGPRVAALQEALISQGFLQTSADGEYGPATIRAVMNFQYSQNVSVDGIAGPDTNELLGIAYP